MDYSIWILCVITFQRLLVIWSPNKFQNIFSRFTTGLIVTILGIIIIFKNLIFGFQFELKLISVTNGMPKTFCGIFKKSDYDIRDAIFAWVELFLNFLIPFPCQFILNILLVFKLKSYTKHFHEVRPHMNNQMKALLHTTTILFVINICFLFCYGPGGIFSLFTVATSIIEKLEENSGNESKVIKNRFYTLQQTTFSLQYFNHVINFVLYLLVGKYFRTNLALVLSRNKEKFLTWLRTAFYTPSRPREFELSQMNRNLYISVYNGLEFEYPELIRNEVTFPNTLASFSHRKGIQSEVENGVIKKHQIYSEKADFDEQEIRIPCNRKFMHKPMLIAPPEAHRVTRMKFLSLNNNRSNTFM